MTNISPCIHLPLFWFLSPFIFIFHTLIFLVKLYSLSQHYKWPTFLLTLLFWFLTLFFSHFLQLYFQSCFIHPLKIEMATFLFILCLSSDSFLLFSYIFSFLVVLFLATFSSPSPQPLLKEHREYGPTIDKLNELGNAYDALLRGERPESPSRRRSSVTPVKRPSVTSPLKSPGIVLRLFCVCWNASLPLL